MLEIKFSANNKPLAAAIGAALLAYSKTLNALGPLATAVAENAARHDVSSAEVEAQADGVQAEQSASQTAISEAAELAPHTQEQVNNAFSDAAAGHQDGRVDLHGVHFCDKHCANAQDPFYKTGPTAGQWKAKRGVSAEVYAAWYASVKPVIEQAEQQVAEEFDTATAFGKQAGIPAAKPPPKNAGEFMVWISEMQTAEHFNQADVTEAYATCNIGQTAIFTSPDAAAHVLALHAVLSQKVPV
jgi:hypothetical protein